MNRVIFFVGLCGFSAGIFSIAGCAQAERSASMVLDNANSVVKTGEEKLWQEPEIAFNPTPTPSRKNSHY